MPSLPPAGSPESGKRLCCQADGAGAPDRAIPCAEISAVCLTNRRSISAMAGASRAQGKRGLQRNKVDLRIAERLRADDLQRLRRRHQSVGGEGDGGELLTVAQDLRGDRLAGIELKIHDE